MDITHNISTLPILSLLVLSRMHLCGSHLQIPKVFRERTHTFTNNKQQQHTYIEYV